MYIKPLCMHHICCSRDIFDFNTKCCFAFPLIDPFHIVNSIVVCVCYLFHYFNKYVGCNYLVAVALVVFVVVVAATRFFMTTVETSKSICEYLECVIRDIIFFIRLEIIAVFSIFEKDNSIS